MRNTLTFQTQFWRKCLPVAALLLLFACQKEKTASNGLQNPGPPGPSTLTPKAVQISAHCRGFYEYLPEGYSNNTGTSYPLIIFFHGAGEIGNDSSGLSRILKNGPLKHVANGSFPSSFTVNGQTYRFIILGPQLDSADNSYPDEVDNIIEFAKKNYRVDKSRIYLTGLSFGAGVSWNYVGKNANYARKIAAMVPIASYLNDTKDAFKITNGKAQVIGASNLPIWATHNQRDNVCPLSWVVDATNQVKNSNASMKPQPKLTIFDEYGHEGWTKTYDPSFKENNMNIYEWMLQYHR
ncbi:MAG: carboxylesterase family protein [Flavisolibacter sp.]